MSDRRKQFERHLNAFPKDVRDVLHTIPVQAGMLSAPQCFQLTQSLGIDLEELMCMLLPLAKIFAIAPISRFRVGAVANAGSKDTADRFDLYLGANMEFLHQPLNQTIHAEQSATMNAWHQGAQPLYALAVSEPPCGYCRQFLNEFEINPKMPVILPSGKDRTVQKIPISDLLPGAIRPSDLGNRTALMTGQGPYHKLSLEIPVKDRMITEALLAAEGSYAPYSKNYAGCVIQTETGEIFKGRSVESAAYNPSLTPLHSAIARMNMAILEENVSIQRVVVVEKTTTVSQCKAVTMLLESWAPGIELEYFEAK
jgi:cytidine deaminase